MRAFVCDFHVWYLLLLLVTVALKSPYFLITDDALYSYNNLLIYSPLSLSLSPLSSSVIIFTRNSFIHTHAPH